MPFPAFTDLSHYLVVISLVLYVGTSVFWAKGIFRWIKQKLQPKSDQLSVSVIIAARNEAALITGCLSSVLAQNYPSHLYEVLVVDDHSTDDTRQLAKQIVSNHHVPAKILDAPPCPIGVGPKKNALAYGISQSAGEILLFTDADCRVSTHWINSHIGCYDEQTGAVAGTTLPENRTGLLKSLHWLERVLVNYTAASAIGWGTPASVNGGNFSYRRAAFTQVGGIAHIDVPSGDDDLMAQAIALKGWRIRFAFGHDSLVSEVRRSTPLQHLNASIRHQSTVLYYPWRWRFAYVLSILAAALFISCIACAAAGLLSWVPLLGLFAIRAAAEIPAVFIFTSRSGINLPLPLAVCGEILLPFYLILRPLAALIPSFTWHGRIHQPRMADATGDAV